MQSNCLRSLCYFVITNATDLQSKINIDTRDINSLVK